MRDSHTRRAHYFSTRTPNKTLAAKIESKKLQELIEQSELGLLKSVSIKLALDKYIQSMSHSKEINHIRNHCNKFMGFKQGIRCASTERTEIRVHGLDPDRGFRFDINGGYSAFRNGTTIGRKFERDDSS
jgi:hypothetical protein